MDTQQYVLEMQGIVKLFPGVKALDGARLQLRGGEVHGLLGENGAGKSTMMNILLGSLRADSGTVTYMGELVEFRNPHTALQRGISMIHQEIKLVGTMTVAENLWLGRESSFTKVGFLDIRAREAATVELLDRLGLKLNPKAKCNTLSVANQQLLEVARAVSYNPKVIIMDEPTSSLTDNETEILFRIIQDLSKQGTATIFISHKLDEVERICDRITILRDGRYIASHDIGDTSQEKLMREIAGREIKTLYPEKHSQIGGVVMEVKNLSATRFKDISFNVRSGEIIGFCGLVGAGRSEIMRGIFGIDKVDSGEVAIDGRRVEIKSPKDAIANGISMVTEDRLKTGIIGKLSVAVNISAAYLPKICNKLSFVKRRREAEDIQRISKTLAIKAASSNQLIASLSGGNQQKALIARWLLTEPKVLILDEPTRGIDVGTKSDIYRLINELTEQGLAVVMISSEMPEVMGMSDRLFVVREGRLVGEQKRGALTQEQLAAELFGIA